MNEKQSIVRFSGLSLYLVGQTFLKYSSYESVTRHFPDKEEYLITLKIGYCEVAKRVGWEGVAVLLKLNGEFIIMFSLQTKTNS